MINIRLDKKIKYQGNGDGWPGGPPHYFQRLSAKYDTHDPRPEKVLKRCPSWLLKFFPKEVVLELVYLRHVALYYFIEAAKLRTRTQSGWHGRRTAGDLRILGGRLARLKGQPRRESEIAELESQIRALQCRREVSRRSYENILNEAQYHWHMAIYMVCEYCQHSKRLPSNVISYLCKWFSFPELGIWCTRDTIKAVRRHFYIDPSGRAARPIYSYSELPRQPNGPATAKNDDRGIETIAVTDDDKSLDEEISRPCGLLCGAKLLPNEVYPHFDRIHGIPEEEINKLPNRRELRKRGTDEVLYRW